MKPTDPTIAALLAAGEALRKAAEGAECELFGLGISVGLRHGGDRASRSLRISRRTGQSIPEKKAAMDIRNRVVRAMIAWDKIAKAARKGRRK